MTTRPPHRRPASGRPASRSGASTAVSADPLYRIALLWLTSLLLGSCGYTVGFAAGDGLAPGGRIGLQVVGNETLRQRFELPITRNLQEQLPIHAGLRPVAPGRAESTLEVEIVDVRNRSMAGPGRPETTPGLPPRNIPVREGALEFGVLARVRNAIDGEIIREWQVLDRAELRIAVGETEDTALAESSFDIARKIATRLADAGASDPAPTTTAPQR